MTLMLAFMNSFERSKGKPQSSTLPMYAFISSLVKVSVAHSKMNPAYSRESGGLWLVELLTNELGGACANRRHLNQVDGKLKIATFAETTNACGDSYSASLHQS